MDHSMSMASSVAAIPALLAATSSQVPVGNVTASNFSIEVIDYYLQDDAAYYQNHIFILQIFIEQNEIRLYRSYASFCELDTKLRRQYPRSSLPTLPLAGASTFQKKHGKRFSILKGSGSSATVSTGATNMAPNATALDVRESIISSAIGHEKGSSHRMLAKRSDAQEVIPNRKPYLTRYLNDLLKIPEVVMSDTFHIFLDEESPMDNQPSHLPEYNEENFQGLEVNLLLQDQSPITKTISKEFLLPMSVYQGGVVVWSFETKQHDIGFSIAFEGKEIVAYQRVQSHTKPVQGYFEVPKSGQMNFLWDNTYSKWRNKQMSFIVRIVDKDAFREVLDQATSMVREKLQKHKQRLLVKKVLGNIAHKAMFSAGSNTDLQQRMLLQQQQQQEQQQQELQSDDPLEHHSTVEGQLNDDFSSPTNHNSPIDAESPSRGQIDAKANDISAFYPPPSQPPPALQAAAPANPYPRIRSSLYGGNASDIVREECAGDNDSSSPGLGFLRPSSLLPSAADHEITIKVLSQQVDVLKSEKSFLQQALSQAEAALVQERSACASNFQQVEDMTMSKEMMEEELQTLQEENESLRKELHDLVQQQQERQWLTSSASSKLLNQLAHRGTSSSASSSTLPGSNSSASLNGGSIDRRRQDSQGSVSDESSMIFTDLGADSLADSAVAQIRFSSQEMDIMKMFMDMSVEEFLLHYPQHQQQQQALSPNQMADNIRHLLSLHHFPGLVTFTRQLLIDKKQLQEQAQQVEQQLLKQKSLSKQLKQAALQLKEQQTQTQALLQHAEHEKHFVISENETLGVKIRSYENQVRLLQKENKEIHEAYRGLYQYVYPSVAGSAVLSSESSSADDTGIETSGIHSSRLVSSTGDGPEEVAVKDAPSSSNNPSDTRNHNHESTKGGEASDHSGGNHHNSTASAASVAERMKQLTQKNWLKRRAAQAPSSESSSVDAIRDTNAASVVKTDPSPDVPFPPPASFHYSSSSTPTPSGGSNVVAAHVHGHAPVFLSPAQLQAQYEQKAQQATDDGSVSSVLPAPTEGDFFDSQVPGQPEEPQRIIVHDFSKAEPDEISTYLSQMTTSFMSMIGAEDIEESLAMLANEGGHDDYSASSQRVITAEEMATFRRYGEPVQGANHTSPAATTSSINYSAGNSHHSPTRSSFLTSLKQMSFGF